MEAGRSQSVTVTHDVDGQVIAPLSERGRLLRRFRLLRGALAVVLMAAAVACLAPLLAAVVIVLQSWGDSSLDIARLVSWSHEETMVATGDFLIVTLAFVFLEAACIVAAVFMLHDRVHPGGWTGVLFATLAGLALTAAAWLQGMDALQGFFILFLCLFAFICAVSLFELWRARWFRAAAGAL